MRILSWGGSICNCRPTCDAERAKATLLCPNCSAVQTVHYADEGSLVALDEWFGDTPPWHIQVWPQPDGTSELAVIEPPEGFDASSQWLAQIGELLENGAYVFPSPRKLA